MPNRQWDSLTESDQILMPTQGGGYLAISLVELLGFDRSALVSTSGFGMAPLHIIEQRGPFQNGSTPLDFRYDERIIQIVIAKSYQNRARMYDAHWEWMEVLRPSRSFGTSAGTNPLIYRKHLPGGKIERGTDMVTTAGSATATSGLGRFVHNGLMPGMDVEIAGTSYEVVDVPNDYTVTVDTVLPATATNVHWKYQRGNSIRDLYCIMERGPSFDEDIDTHHYPAGFVEAIRFRAHDPFWYGIEQQQEWVFPDSVGDLVFDRPAGCANECKYGAWFGPSKGDGRWVFAQSNTMETINIIYWGHEVAYPTIVMTGPFDSASIANLSTNRSIVVNTSVPNGTSITIDLIDLSATDNFGNNLSAYIDGDKATFGIESPPVVDEQRRNSMLVTQINSDDNTSAIIKWKNKYNSL